MIRKSLNWNPKAFKALVRAFAPMPPDIRERALQKIIDSIEDYVRMPGRDTVDFENVYHVSKEILKSKERYMYESLVNSLRAEGFEVKE